MSETQSEPSPQTPPSSADAQPRPIFILGVLPRSGTNHLADLFEMHPDVHVMKPIFEDALIRHTHHLRSYVSDVSRTWSPEWEVPTNEPDDLLRAIGGGIVNWMQGHAAEGRTVVTKMPNLENAENFFDLFPNAHLVLLVRDGRSICESGHRSFGQPREYWFRRFRLAGGKAVELRQRFEGHPGFHYVRYDDVIADRPTEMRKLLAATGLAPERFPFESIEQLPVRGSSEISTTGAEMHWEPISADATFNPKERWRTWEPGVHRTFADVAGEVHEALATASNRSLGAPTSKHRPHPGDAVARPEPASCGSCSSAR